MVRTIELSKISGHLEEYTRELSKSPLVITRKGTPVAVLIAVDDIDVETLAVSTNPDFWAIIEESQAAHEKEGGISSEEVARRLGIPKRG
ncbi:MAG: type II toxin-antitoxin system prevent-host-death family antitoxin [Chloroflexi bacterium]|nr:type II toxin-antitoxin system prevent-host-death family antitoxin [Chloroflexota bacterium]